MSQIGNDMRDLRDEAMASGGRLADDARAELARLRDQVERLMSERVTPALGAAAETVEDYSHRVRDTVEENANALADNIKAQPLLAVGIAAVAGYLLGRLMSPKTVVYERK